MTLYGSNKVSKISGADVTLSKSISQSGYSLIYSNQPESITDNHIADNGTAKYLYRDSSVTRARVMIHHANTTSSPVNFLIRLKNTQSYPVDIYISSKGSVSDQDPRVASGEAWRQWYAGTGSQYGYNSGDWYVATVAAGSTYDLTSITNVPNSPYAHCAAAIVDFVAASGGIAVPVEITVLAYKTNIASSLSATSVPSGYNSSYVGQVRGTFKYCNRDVTFNFDTASQSQYLHLGRPITTSAWANEYELGIDKTNGIQVRINGNYGVIYKIQSTLTDSLHKGYVFGYLQSGFPNFYVMCEDNKNNVTTSSTIDDSSKAWNFEGSQIQNNSSVSHTLLYTLIGGNASPVDLYWANLT